MIRKLSLLNIWFLSLFCVLGSVLAVQAQRNSVEVRFLFLDETEGEFSVKEGGNYTKVSSYIYAISSPVATSPGQRLEVYKTFPGNTDKGPSRVRIATVNIPSNTDETSSLLAVLKPRSEGSSSYDVAYFNDDRRAFPAGSVRVLNLGRAPMAAVLGSERTLLQPGATEILRPKADHKNRLPVQIAERRSDGWKMLYSSIAMLRPGERVTGILVYSPSGMKHTYDPGELQEFGNPPPGHTWLTYTDRIND